MSPSFLCTKDVCCCCVSESVPEEAVLPHPHPGGGGGGPHPHPLLLPPLLLGNNTHSRQPTSPIPDTCRSGRSANVLNRLSREDADEEITVMPFVWLDGNSFRRARWLELKKWLNGQWLLWKQSKRNNVILRRTWSHGNRCDITIHREGCFLFRGGRNKKKTASSLLGTTGGSRPPKNDRQSIRLNGRSSFTWHSTCFWVRRFICYTHLSLL